LCSKRGRASGVANDLSVSSVGRAVDFNDHSRLKAGEVGHEATKNNLATESEACACWRLMPCHRRCSALVALRLRLRAKVVNRLGMARPPTLTRPHKGGGDAPKFRARYSTLTSVFTELAMKQISWAW
jgi:hypothetical protein